MKQEGGGWGGDPQEKLPSKNPALFELKSIADTSVTECDKIIIVMDNISTKKTDAIATNVASTASIILIVKK